jgi:hypothetical protein
LNNLKLLEKECLFHSYIVGYMASASVGMATWCLNESESLAKWKIESFFGLIKGHW